MTALYRTILYATGAVVFCPVFVVRDLDLVVAGRQPARQEIEDAVVIGVLKP